MLNRTILFIKGTFNDAFRLVSSPRQGLKYVFAVSLYRNAVYLTINFGVTSVLGFVFWIVVARFYSAEEVGLGSALISAATLFSFVGTLGFGYAIIRFFPQSQEKAKLLNSSFTIAALVAVAASLIFLAGLPFWSPQLMFVRQSLAFFSTFVLFVAAEAVLQVLVLVFIACRRSGFTVAHSVIRNLLRLAVVIGVSSLMNVFGIFASWGVSAAVSLVVCLFIFLPRVVPGYRPIPSFQYKASGEMVRFSLANYVGDLVSSLPSRILPLMVVSILGAEANAYFFMSWVMADLLLTVCSGVAMSLFAEGSSAAGRLGGDIRKSLKFMVLFLIPGIVIMALLADKILLVFGREYSAEGTKLLWLLAPAAFPASINTLYLSVARVEKKLRSVLLMTGAIALGTLVLSHSLMPHLGILGVGVGWLGSQTLVALVVSFEFRKRLRVVV